jgi:hypothetical protein
MGLSVAAIKGRVFHARKELGRALRRHVRLHRTPGGNITVIVRNDTRQLARRLDVCLELGLRRNALMITFLLIAALTILAFLCVTVPDSVIRAKHDQ